MYSGNTPVPVDPQLPPAALAFIVEKSDARAVVLPVAHEQYRDLPEWADASSQRAALVMFTSGTTGHPKGVLISHANLLHSCSTVAAYLDYHRFRSAAVALPLHYSYALLSQVCCQLSVGGRVRLFGDLRNPLKFAQRVADERLETFCGVPSTFHALAAFDALKPLCFDTVRVVCSAGAALDRSRLDAIRRMFPRATFFNNYGMTEAAPRIAFIREDDPRFGETTCGRPMAGVEVKVVDPQTNETRPDGEPGMLVVRGPNITTGYLNDPELSADAFTPDGYLKSGDLAHLDRGYIFIRGRYDDVFNCGGEKVAPLEIERELNQVPGVESSAVTGVPDDLRGMVPVAFVRLTTSLDRGQIVAALVRALPKIKVPQRYFEVSGFPMTSNGKLQRNRLSPADTTYVVREIV